MTKEHIVALHKHANLRIAMKKAMLLYCAHRISIEELNKAIDAVEDSVISIVQRGLLYDDTRPTVDNIVNNPIDKVNEIPEESMKSYTDPDIRADFCKDLTVAVVKQLRKVPLDQRSLLRTVLQDSASLYSPYTSDMIDKLLKRSKR